MSANAVSEAATGAGVAARNASALKTIAVAGLLAGALDILYIIVFYLFRGVGATRVLQGVAAGLIGPDAAGAGGLATAALGLAVHFAIALTVAAVFYVLSRKLRVLVAQPILSGAVYGVVVWLAMNLAVLPLTATPPKSFPSPMWMPVLIAHIFCVGLPIALVVRRMAPR